MHQGAAYDPAVDVLNRLRDVGTVADGAAVRSQQHATGYFDAFSCCPAEFMGHEG